MTEGCEQDRNAIIESLPVKERRRFKTLCHITPLSQGDVLCESEQDQQAVYFPTSGVIALNMNVVDHPCLELGMIGRDGMVGAQLSMATLNATMRAVVQVAGSALKMPAVKLQQELLSSARLLESIQHYQSRVMMQIQQNAVCLHFHEVESRLARWLLTIQDSSLNDTLQITHKQLANALGVRRSGITHAVGSLHLRGSISSSRGAIRIVDHTRLEGSACNCYAALINRYRMASCIN